MKRIFGLFYVVALLFACGGCGRAEKPVRFVVVGTGAVTGVYYPAGGAITRLVNNKFYEHRIKATVVPSYNASTANLKAVDCGKNEFGIAQSDTLGYAYDGRREWDGHPRKNLRSVFALHPESLALVASERSGVRRLEDLRGKAVRMSSPASDLVLPEVEQVLSTVGLTPQDLRSKPLKEVDCPAKLQAGEIDAYFYRVGHPNANLVEVSSGAEKVFVVPIANAGVDSLLRECPFYCRAVIPRAFYPNIMNASDIPTIGVNAVFFTVDNMDDDVVYAFAKEVFENFDQLKSLHPALASLCREDLLKGLTVPVHPGAMRYYREAGLDKLIEGAPATGVSK